jgi:transcriptional regulator with XRE-family HTH domain
MPQQPTQSPSGSRLTPNQLVAERIAFARKARGWTQEEAAEILEPFLGQRWSSATFSIIERSVDGKRIRQFSTDDLVALSRAFQVPIGFWITPSWTDEGHPRVVTPDVPEGLPSQTLLDVLMGNDSGWDLWASELLNWAATQAFRRHPVTGDLEPDREITDDLEGLVDNLTKLRAHTAMVREFGDLLSAKEGLQRVLAVLDTLMFDPDTESAPTDKPNKGKA